MSRDAMIAPVATGGAPAPRHRLLLLAAVAAPPLGWSAALLLDTLLAGRSCAGPAATGGHAWLVGPGLTAIDLVSLAIGLLAALTGLVLWRRLPGPVRPTLIETAEENTHFLAAWGLMSGMIFLLATLFCGLPLWLASLCGK